MEIRRRKIIRRYVYGGMRTTCKRNDTQEQDELYHPRYVLPRDSEELDSPTYRMIETREPLSSRRSLSNLWRLRSSPTRSQPFRMYLPFMRQATVSEEDMDITEREPRGRRASPRLFVVDSPGEIRHVWPRSERTRSPSPRIRSISPRSRSLSFHRDTAITMEDAREPRSLERPKGPRPPRERTPVVEREPIRRKPRQSPARTAEVRQSPNRSRERSRSSGRQVRFSQEVEYEESRNRPRGRHGIRQPDSREVQGQIRRDIFGRTTAATSDISDRASLRSLSPSRTAYWRARSPWPSRLADTDRANKHSSRRSENVRPRARIIRDGNRELSEAEERIHAAARRRGSRGNFLYNFVTHSRSRQKRRANHARGFISEDEITLRRRRFRRYSCRC
ncbi:hypothetical protein P175DRAFT_0534385 [Aspergillus ochraceoroseus IBT 24754]|uniref:Uncharacterized protein n=3 Tax=Aspergillus subgen. Nidulantes TaxID=2720870 RepID=A0A0F8UQ49_9EURO|nr:uncharacterized protein P175DRAFT_0534385 [Aspergillus ochraceoroseus IBT 24754]KKK21623.1 hypothetical protein ARAM_007376 [Aspergillus rambellii]KKK26100.1 hypothetical protein AOCH_002139 [Aspergillus ochraceoroseus]PTU18640.1 hypothetical protein P175DRAFT_0534385 [Aspergillus ochraceoroseus IBT 24754]